MAKLYIDLSGRKGLSKKFAGDITDSVGSPQLRYLANDGEMVQGEFNPIRKYGYMAPIPGAYTTVSENDANQNFTNRIRATQYDAEYDVAYMVEDGDLTWKTSSGSLTTWNGTGTGSPLSGSALHFTDIEIYQVNGVKKTFMSYMKSGGGDIMLFGTNSDFSSTSTNATWLSGTVSGAFHTGATSDVFMRTADNGYMYIFDTNAIHKFDGTTATGGTNGTVTANSIVFPFGYFLSDAVDWRGKIWAALQTTPATGITSFSQTNGASRICGVYVWDRSSAVSSSTDFIPMSGVREIRKLYVTQEGELRAIVISSQRLTQIRRYNGSTFEVMVELGGTAFPTFRDSVGQMGQFTVWFGYDGIIYAHGKIAPGEADGLYILGDTTALVGASPSNGAILIVDNNGSSDSARDGILWSAKSNGGTVYNRYLYPHSTGTVPLAGNVYSPLKFLPKLSTVNYVNIICAPTASSASTAIGTVDLYFNQSTSSFKTHSVTMAQASRGYINIPVGKPYVNAAQLEIKWDTGNNIGTSDFLPAYAEIDYTPTETFK